MAEPDFNPQKTTREIDEWTGRVQRDRFYPADGSTVAVVYINASANLAAIQARLDEIVALSDNFQKVTWTATAEAGLVPAVDVRVTVRTDVEAPE